MKTVGLAGFVRERRLARGWTQADLADAAGVGQPFVAKVETGATKLPTADARRRLAAALDVPHLALLVAAGELTEAEANLPADVLTPGERWLLDCADGLRLDAGQRDHLGAVVGALKRDQARRDGAGDGTATAPLPFGVGLRPK